MGDRVMVEVEVVRIAPPVPGGQHKHIRARVPRDATHPWMVGDQYLWTWGWSQATDRKIEVVR